MKKIGAIVLAAGRGKRVNSKTINKVMLPLAGRPMIAYTMDLLKSLGLKDIIVVVGFAKETVKKFLGPKYIYAEQRKRLGTGHAVSRGLKKIKDKTSILVLNGDDSAFYTPSIIRNLLKIHQKKKAKLSFLTLEKNNPFGLGRILRDKSGIPKAVIEEKEATEKQKKIKEVNPGCFVFEVKFLKKYLPKIKKGKIGEYYLTDLVKLAIINKEKIETLKINQIIWQGVNTPEELKEADRLMRERLKCNN